MNQTLFGRRVVIEPTCETPRMQLSPHVAKDLDPKFVKEMNLWMANFFGMESRAYYVGDHTIVIGPNTYENLRRKFE